MSAHHLQTLAQYYTDYSDSGVEATTSSNMFSSPVAWAGGLVVLVSLWFVFKKAKRPGWAAIIPIYSTLVMIWIVKRPWWWFLLLLIPIVNIVVAIMLTYELAKAFGKGGWFTVLLILLPFIGFPILGFGSAKYTAPKR
jgi:hypothetical protein